jgi:hypothetical protein
MNDELAPREPSPTSVARGRRFRRRELRLADGGRLFLGVDGSINHLDEGGTTVRSWAPDDPEWPDQAIRFGLHPQAPTVRPQERGVPGTKPPRW